MFTFPNFLIQFVRKLFCRKTKFYPNLGNLSRIIGFSPRNYKYYELAFTHRSASLTEPDGSLVNNERLEFLGDAILGSIVADLLFHKFPNENEGFLTQMRSKIVNGENLHKLAKEIGIHKFVVTKTDGFSQKKNIFGDAFEALIGAIYIDKGYKSAENFIINKIINKHINLTQLEATDTNYKSKLIEWGQKYKKPVNFYTDLESSESKFFISYVKVMDEIKGSGKGKSKKEAEQNAAKNTLQKVEETS